MTSKKSFYNMLIISLRGRLWGLALTCIGLFFSLPIYGAIYASSQLLTGDSLIVASPDIMARLFRTNVLGPANVFLSFIIFILAIFYAINGFMYIFSKPQTDLYHSLPIKRNILFGANYLSGIIAFIIPYLAFTFVTVIIGSCYGMVNADSIKVALLSVFINILGFLIEYSTAAAIIMLTGTRPAAVLAVATVNLYGPIIYAIHKMYQEQFFITYSYKNANGVWPLCSPISLYAALGDELNAFSADYSLSIPRTLEMAAAIILMSLIAYKLYANRATESCGTAIAYKRIIPFLSVLLLTPTGLFSAAMFDDVTNHTQNNDYGWFIFGLVISIIIGHFILQAIYYQDFRSIFKSLKLPAISIVLAALISIIFIKDLCGYDTYLPDNSISSVSISSYSLNHAQTYYDFDTETDEWGYRNYTVESDEYALKNMALTNPEIYLPFLRAAIDENREFSNYIKNIDAYNDSANAPAENYANIDVCFTTKNGRKIYRAYNMRMDKVLKEFNDLYCTKEYKDGVYTILTADDSSILDNLCYYDNLGCTTLGDNKLTAADRQLLLDTYRAELRDLTAYDLVENMPIGYICTKKNILDSGYTSSYCFNMGYVYPTFTKTIALLESYDIDLYRYKDISNISSIKVENYLTEDDMNIVSDESDSCITAYFKDSKEIAQILDSTVPSEFYGVDDAFHPFSALDCTVSYTAPVDSYISSAALTFLPDNVPDFVKQAVKYKN